jgi:putative ABC transport system permease protein
MGTNTLVVRSGASRGGGVRGGAGSQPSITWDDAKAIEAEIGGVTAVVPELTSSAQVVGEEGNWQTQVIGTTPAWFTVRNLDVDAGEVFSDAEVNGQAKVAVIGQTVATNLFGDLSPVGQTIRINRIPFQVVGLAEAKGMSPFGTDNDDRVVIPVTAYTSKISRGGVQKYIGGSLLVATPSRDATVKAQAAIGDLLRRRHHPPGRRGRLQRARPIRDRPGPAGERRDHHLARRRRLRST